MIQFTSTPEEFATGQMSAKARDLFRQNKPRARPAQPRLKKPDNSLQIGTVTPEDFAAGRPYAGRRAYGHRVDGVPTLKPLPESKQVFRIQVGKTYWFEYHCEESHTSADAEVWYHSHQKAKVLRMTQKGDGLTYAERGNNGMCAHYQIIFADGFETEAGEDELLASPSEYFRPDPPARRKSMPESIVNTLLEDGQRLRTLRDLQAMPDDQAYLCHDATVAERHRISVPFKCGCRQWAGGGVVKVDFYSQRYAYAVTGQGFQDYDYASLRTLEVIPGDTWNFDITPGF